LPVFSKGGERGASWRHMRVRLIEGKGKER
jgi:hypothetical protein